VSGKIPDLVGKIGADMARPFVAGALIAADYTRLNQPAKIKTAGGYGWEGRGWARLFGSALFGSTLLGSRLFGSSVVW
jgi:hypothetical protein